MNALSSTEVSSPMVSIVVTSFNRVYYLQETMSTILSQTFDDFELIVVDNMSADGTENYIKDISDPRVTFYQNDNGGIVAVNRNFGIQRAKGKYIALCDDDDLWLPSKLQKQVALMESKPNLAMCYSNAESFSEEGILEKKMCTRTVKSNFFTQLLRGSFIPNSSVLIRSDVFKEIGLLTTSPLLREDYHMWLRISKSYDIEGIDESLIRYRVHNANAAGNRARETLRAIRTVKSVMQTFGIPQYVMIPNIGFQYLKYLYYRLFGS